VEDLEAVMAYLPHDPRNVRELVLADLLRAQRLIVRIQDEIDPQFRFATPEGDYHIAVTLPSDDRERRQMLRRIATFMAWKQAVGFTLASELHQPDCVYCLGVTHKELRVCFSRIRREPRPWTEESFGPVEWGDRSQVGQELIDLLPTGAREISAAEIAMLDKWFGPEGRFPAVRIG
jgi:hypothetical protein